MHVPDHLLNDPTEVVAAASAVAVIAAASLVSRRGSAPAAEPLLPRPDRPAPLLAVAGLVFALQMVNFPVLSGTSGHLLGGALATALIGPRRALLAMTAVVTTQALCFGDGGLAALGVNLWLIAILPVGIAAAVGALTPRRTRLTPLGGPALAAVLAPAASALAFSLLHGLTSTNADVAATAGPMLRVHLAIGLGEAAITTVVLAAVLVVQRLELPRLSPVAAVWGVAVLSAATLSTVASSSPDGLERVATDLGFAVEGPTSILEGGPLQDYAMSGLSGSAATSVAGLAGLVLVSAVAVALVAADRGARRAGDVALTA